MEQKTNWLYLIIAFVIGAVAGAFIYAFSAKNISYNNWSDISSAPASTDTENQQTNQTTGSVSPDVKEQPSYGEMVLEYQGKRIQFKECQAIPTYMTVKSGAKIMLDNRSEKEQTIILDDFSHQLPGYTFKTVTLTTDQNHSVKIDCETGDTPQYNIAQVLIQP